MSTHHWATPESTTKETDRAKVKPPSQYKVILNNDDYTTMEFVIDVLQRFFSMDIDRATQLMLAIHYEGKAVCGIFTAEVAEMKVLQVMSYARQHEHPLLCTMERA